MPNDIRTAILDAARSRANLSYRLDPPPDGVTTTDCSLLVVDAARDAGVALPPGVRTAEQIRQACVPIEQDDVKPADLLFFAGTYDAAGPAGPDGKIASHIGFSLGRGTGQMIDAHERDGADVAVTNIRTDYWSPKLFDFRRLPGLSSVSQPSTESPKQEALLRGIDVASHQGSIVWDSVAAAGYLFAITKATEDDGYLNPTFAYNWREIRRIGMQRGAYHFARPEQSDAIEEADYFLSCVDAAGGLLTGDMLALDLEAGDGDLGQWVLDFMHRCEARAGFKPLLYTGAWFSGPHNLGAYPEIADYGLWLAAYGPTMPAAPEPWKSAGNPIAFWQFTDALTVPGIVGNVDGNVFNGDASRMVFYGKPGTVVPTPLPVPDPRDARIAELEAQVSSLKADLDSERTKLGVLHAQYSPTLNDVSKAIEALAPGG